jgi:transglutaminase-like putative cysteine protease
MNITFSFRSYTLAIFCLLVLSNATAEIYIPPIVVESSRHIFDVKSSGQYTQIVEKTTRIINDYGTHNYGRHIFESNTSKEKLKIEDAYNITPGGKKIRLSSDWISKQHPKPDNEKTIDDTQKTLVIFPQVAVGSRLYSRSRLTFLKPMKRGQFGASYVLSPQSVWENLEVIITAPKNLKLYTSAKGFEGGIVKTTSTHFTYHFTAQQNHAFKDEDESIDNNDFSPRLVISTYPDFLAIGNEYHQASRIKASPTPEIIHQVEKLTADLTDPRDKARNLYQWVSKNIRYISNTIDDGGFVPRSAGYIFRNRFGDCKDHVVLLETMLRIAGIESTAALINQGDAFLLQEGAADHRPLNHVITYIPSMDLYLDSTARFSPFGQLHNSIFDKPTILVTLNRYGRTPKMNAADHRVVTYVNMNMTPDGAIEGSSKTDMVGAPEIESRANRFYAQNDSMEATVNTLLYRFNEIGRGEIQHTPPLEIDKPYKVDATFQLESIADLTRTGAFSIPVGLAPGRIAVMTILKPLAKRHFNFVCNSYIDEEHYRLNLPVSLKIVSLPRDVSYNDENIKFESRYTRDGQTLIVKRILKVDYPTRICTPKDHDQYVKSVQVLRLDQRAQVVFE